MPGRATHHPMCGCRCCHDVDSHRLWPAEPSHARSARSRALLTIVSTAFLELGRPAALLWPRLLFAPGGPWRHGHGDHAKRLDGAVGAELEHGPEWNRETDAGPQVHRCWLMTFLTTPHLSRATDDVPDLLNGGMRDGFRDLAGLKLELSKAAEPAELAQRPNR